MTSPRSPQFISLPALVCECSMHLSGYKIQMNEGPGSGVPVSQRYEPNHIFMRDVLPERLEVVVNEPVIVLKAFWEKCFRKGFRVPGITQVVQQMPDRYKL